MARVQREVEVLETIKLDVLVCDGCKHTVLFHDPHSGKLHPRLKDLTRHGINPPVDFYSWLVIAGTGLPGDSGVFDDDKHFCHTCRDRIVATALKGI